MKMFQEYDIIGDIHGQYGLLVKLLEKLGCTCTKEFSWQPPAGKCLVFLGDLIDRGPQSLEVVRTVQSLTAAGDAYCIMGNHEFNAICWATAASDRPGGYLREHSYGNKVPHEPFLAQVGGEGSDLHKELVAWFRTLPLWLQFGGMQCVHACWSPEEMQRLHQLVDLKGHASELFFREASRKHSGLDLVLKGPEKDLPQGVSFRDKDGKERHEGRVKWWLDAERVSWADYVIVPDDCQSNMPVCDVPSKDYTPFRPSCATFFGHYWMEPGAPKEPQTAMATCLDFSAGTGGPLVCYRWNEGDTVLSADRFVWVNP